MHRLSLADRELVRAGTAIMALPQNAALGARLVWETADAIWDGLGDRSDDVNWYSKRATLSAVHGATVLYWLGDDSPDAAATRDFLDRRIDGLMRFEGVKRPPCRPAGHAGADPAPRPAGSRPRDPARRPQRPIRRLVGRQPSRRPKR